VLPFSVAATESLVMFTDADISVILLDERKHEENEKQNLMAIE